MSLRIIPKHLQGKGAFNGGQIIENKPIGFPRDGSHVRPYSNLFYWARAEALVDSTIGLHPHQGFEIMSFVLEGQIRHFDSAHEEWRPLNAGDVQIIRAGSGIKHAEHLEKGAVIFQIWTDPDLSKTLEKEATYNDYPASGFSTISENGSDTTVLVGEGSPIQMDTPEVEISRVHFDGEVTLHQQNAVTSLYVIDGAGMIGDQGFGKDDFMIIEGEEAISLKANDPVDLFRITSPVEPGYATYAHRLSRHE